MRIAIDLLWVKPRKNGGTESYIRNLLDGFEKYIDGHTFVLFVSEDNRDTFMKYSGSKFELIACPINTASFIKRVIWENVSLKKFSQDQNIDVWFFPVYSRPFNMSKLPTITVIHDLQALHYPEYFSKIRNLYFRIAWKNDCKRSIKIITDSEFCKEDIIKNFSVDAGRIEAIYIPIICEDKSADFSKISDKYGIKKNEYFYTVSSLAKHKNLITVIKAMRLLKNSGINNKLVISGVKENAEGELFEFIRKNSLEDIIIYTGFVSNEERNALYDNCRKFIFPSVFEGFGMPPIEAMIRGVPVLTTKEASIYEVTEGMAEYIKDPFDEAEWAMRMGMEVESNRRIPVDMFKEKYGMECAARRYIEVISDSVDKS